MVKMIFFDLDDCLAESSTKLQGMVDARTEFKNVILTQLEYMKSMAKYAYEYNAREIERAMAQGEKPNIIGNIKAGSNDIFKTSYNNEKLSELEKDKNRIKRWYYDPLELAKSIYEKTCNDLEMFKEERDHFLEMDNQKSFEEGCVVYQDIYVIENMIPGAFNMVNDVYNSGEYDGGVYVLSHHNGGREEIVKNNFVTNTFRNVPFLGMRFHAEEYQKGVRRPRSSKALYIMKKFNLLDLSGCVLVDDSLENLDEWAKYGGIAVLYRPLSQDEIHFGKMFDHGREYPRITRMDKILLDEALGKQKQKKMI